LISFVGKNLPHCDQQVKVMYRGSIIVKRKGEKASRTYIVI